MAEQKPANLRLIVDREARVRLRLPYTAELYRAGRRDGGKDRQIDVGPMLLTDFVEDLTYQHAKTAKVAFVAQDARAEAAAADLPDRDIIGVERRPNALVGDLGGYGQLQGKRRLAGLTRSG